MRKVLVGESLDHEFAGEQCLPHHRIREPQPIVDAIRASRCICQHRHAVPVVGDVEACARQRLRPIFPVGKERVEFVRVAERILWIEARREHQRQAQGRPIRRMAVGQRGPDEGLPCHQTTSSANAPQ